MPDNNSYGQAIAALEYMATAVAAGDSSALHFAAFVWAQRGDNILLGMETWADQRMPPIVMGGGVVEAPLRTRKLGPLDPPQPGDAHIPAGEEVTLQNSSDVRAAWVMKLADAAGVDVFTVEQDELDPSWFLGDV